MLAFFPELLPELLDSEVLEDLDPISGNTDFHDDAVAEGSSVKSGDTIVIVESMKMELEIKAASAGTVHFLLQSGTQINAGQALAEIK